MMSLGLNVSFYFIFYFIFSLLTKLFRYILLLMTMTTWRHHHHHHHCKPLLTGWMGEGEEMRGRSNNDERGGHP